MVARSMVSREKRTARVGVWHEANRKMIAHTAKMAYRAMVVFAGHVRPLILYHVISIVEDFVGDDVVGFHFSHGSHHGDEADIISEEEIDVAWEVHFFADKIDVVASVVFAGRSPSGDVVFDGTSFHFDGVVAQELHGGADAVDHAVELTESGVGLIEGKSQPSVAWIVTNVKRVVVAHASGRLCHRSSVCSLFRRLKR